MLDYKKETESYMKKAIVIFNPKSGLTKKIDKNLENSIKKVFLQYDYEVEIIFTQYKGHAETLMMELDNSIDLVMSFGGDGTFNEVITGNVQKSLSKRINPT